MKFNIAIKGGGPDPNYKTVNAIMAGMQLIDVLKQKFILSEVSEGKEPCIILEEFMGNKSLITMVVSAKGENYEKFMEALLEKYCLIREATFTKD